MNEIKLTLMACLLLGAAGPIHAQIQRAPGRLPLANLPPRTSGETIVTPAPAQPGPANLSVTGSPTEATIRWEAVPGATGYMVTRTDAIHGAIVMTQSPITATSLQDGSGRFDFRAPITYRVLAVYPGGQYGATETTFALPIPGPTNAFFTGDKHGPRVLSWTAAPSASGYVLKRRVIRSRYDSSYRVVGYDTIREEIVNVDGSLSSFTFGRDISLAWYDHDSFEVAAVYQPGNATSPWVHVNRKY